jgi:hypothetical protein
MNTTRKMSLKNLVLTSVAVAGLMAGTTACGGSNDESSAEEQALIELLLGAAQRGASDEVAAIVAQADPDVVAQVLPEVEEQLGADLGIEVPAGAPAADAETASQESATDADSTTSDESGSTPEIDLGLPDGLDTGGIEPGDLTASIPTLPTPNLPASSAPSVSIPNISLPGIPTLPAPNLPTPTKIEDVKLLTVGNVWKLEVLVSGGVWDPSTGTRSPESVFVRYRIAGGRIQSKYMTLDGRLGTSTTIWAEYLSRDADPCSFEIAVAPSTTFQRFRLGESC